jgi:hypothetical protein
MSTIPAWAVKGAKVVCVDLLSHRDEWVRKQCPNIPVKGRVYTIRDVETCPLTSHTTLTFDELQNPVIELEGMTGEAGFNVTSFRPVTKRTAAQDIAEHFSHHLTVNAPHEVDA